MRLLLLLIALFDEHFQFESHHLSISIVYKKKAPPKDKVFGGAQLLSVTGSDLLN